jgi:long-chain acyl-CoA synthetase
MDRAPGPVRDRPDALPSAVALFEEAVAKYADHPAFECFGHTMMFTPKSTAPSRAVAAWLQKSAASSGDRIALMVPNVLAFPGGECSAYIAPGRRR